MASNDAAPDGPPSCAGVVTSPATRKRSRSQSEAGCNEDQSSDTSRTSTAQRRRAPRFETLMTKMRELVVSRHLPVSPSGGPSALSSLPAFGLGTFRAKGPRLIVAVEYALKTLGVRLIDTAESYKNAGDIWQGIVKSGVPRGEVTIVTKVAKESMSNHGVRKCVADQRALLGGAPLDVVLLHWPGSATANPQSKNHAAARLEAWRALLAEVAAGNVLHAGVSNFSVAHLEELRKAFPDALPFLNQIEVHPYYPQREVVEWCRRHGVIVQSYTTLGRCNEPPKCLYGIREPDHPRLVNDPRVKAIAQRFHITAPQVLLTWALRKGYAVIPKAVNLDHLKENAMSLLLMDLLTPEDFLVLDGMHSGPLDAPPGSAPITYAYPAAKIPL